MCCILGYLGKDLTTETFTSYLMRTKTRGPDDQRVVETEFGLLGFGRLAIMGLTPDGMQPFEKDGSYALCNGEIYGSRHEKDWKSWATAFPACSDCELLLPLYQEYGLEMFQHLDAEFACVLYDGQQKELIAARDPIGIRPLFYGYSESGHIAFASEAKSLVGWIKEIRPFPPGHYYYKGQILPYTKIEKVEQYHHEDLSTITRNIREKLSPAWKKGWTPTAPLGFFFPAVLIPAWCAPSAPGC